MYYSLNAYSAFFLLEQHNQTIKIMFVVHIKKDMCLIRRIKIRFFSNKTYKKYSIDKKLVSKFNAFIFAYACFMKSWLFICFYFWRQIIGFWELGHQRNINLYELNEIDRITFSVVEKYPIRLNFQDYVKAVFSNHMKEEKWITMYIETFNYSDEILFS